MPEVEVIYSDGESSSTDVISGTNLLDALITKHVPYAYNCRAGSCQTCICLDMESGANLLLCQTLAPDRNLKLRVDYTRDEAGATVSIRRAKLLKAELVGGEAYRLDFRLEFPLAFQPGQYATVMLPTAEPGQKRESRFFSFGGDPRNQIEARFWVRAIPGGATTTYIEEQARPSDIWKLAGPQGLFTLRPTAVPRIFVGGGTGLSPMLPMLDFLCDEAPELSYWLFFGVARGESLFAIDEIAKLQARLPGLRVFICSDDGLGPRTHPGNVVEVLGRAVYGGLLDGAKEAYLCGPPGMMAAAKKTLETLIPRSSIYFEEFVESGQKSLEKV